MNNFLFIYGGFESHGIEILSSYIKRKGCKADLFFFSKVFNDSILENKFFSKFFFEREFKKLINKIKQEKYDAICFSVVSNDYLWAISLAKKLKELFSDIKIIFGGIHPTLVPEKVIENKFVDYVCEGDGEPFFDGLISSQDIISNMWKKEKNKVTKPEKYEKYDVDPEIIPDKHLFYEKIPYSRDVLTFQFTRGCLFKCSFCFHSCINASFKRKFQFLSTEEAINQLEILKNRFKPKYIVFDDDLFIFNKKHAIEFLKLYKEKIDIPFMCVIYPEFVDQKILDLLKKAGCDKIELAVQTLNKEVRKNILNRKDSLNRTIKSLKLIDKTGIRFNIQHMMGIPETSISDEENAAKLYSKYKNLGRIYTFFLTYYPNIEITRWAYENGEIDSEKHLNILNGKVSSYEMEGDLKGNLREYNGIRILFSLIPILHRSVIKFIIRKRSYMFFERFSFLFRIFDTLNILKNNDITAKIYIKRYIHTFYNVLIKRNY